MSILDNVIADMEYILDTLMTYRNIAETGNCNTCKNKDCQWKPKPGQLVRYNCPHYKVEKKMTNDYIRKQDAVDAIGEEYAPRTDFERGMVSQLSCDKEKIKALPSADVAPVRHGTWLPIVSYNNTYKCSECGRLLVDITDGLKMVAKHYPYCHCGAKMDGEE